MGILVVYFLDGFKDLANGLVVLHFTRMPFDQVIHDGIYVHNLLFFCAVKLLFLRRLYNPGKYD